MAYHSLESFYYDMGDLTSAYKCAFRTSEHCSNSRHTLDVGLRVCDFQSLFFCLFLFRSAISISLRLSVSLSDSYSYFLFYSLHPFQLDFVFMLYNQCNNGFFGGGLVGVGDDLFSL